MWFRTSFSNCVKWATLTSSISYKWRNQSFLRGALWRLVFVIVTISVSLSWWIQDMDVCLPTHVETDTCIWIFLHGTSCVYVITQPQAHTYISSSNPGTHSSHCLLLCTPTLREKHCPHPPPTSFSFQFQSLTVAVQPPAVPWLITGTLCLCAFPWPLVSQILPATPVGILLHILQVLSNVPTSGRLFGYNLCSILMSSDLLNDFLICTYSVLLGALIDEFCHLQL